MITHSRACEVVDYCATTGRMTLKKRRFTRDKKMGFKLGSMEKSGYTRINIDGERFMSHRLAWFIYYGKIPSKHLDHINGNRSDNRIVNLREVSVRMNGQNRPEHRAGHLPGTCKTRFGRWLSNIQIDGEKVYLGSFKTKEEAHSAYLQKIKESCANK